LNKRNPPWLRVNGRTVDFPITTENVELIRILQNELKEYEYLAKSNAGIAIPKERYRVFLES